MGVTVRLLGRVGTQAPYNMWYSLWLQLILIIFLDVCKSSQADGLIWTSVAQLKKEMLKLKRINYIGGVSWYSGLHQCLPLQGSVFQILLRALFFVFIK